MTGWTVVVECLLLAKYVPASSTFITGTIERPLIAYTSCMDFELGIAGLGFTCLICGVAGVFWGNIWLDFRFLLQDWLIIFATRLAV